MQEMRHFGWRREVLAVFLLFIFAPTAFAQTTTGTIEGEIRDTNGRGVTGVTVVANSPALIRRDLTVASDADGFYRLALLPPGVYELTMSVAGFQSVRLVDLTVRAGQTATEDVTMRVAPVSEAVVVSAAASLIDPRSTKLAFSYTASLVENIPGARNVGAVFATIPGVESANHYGIYQPGVIEIQTVLGAGERANAFRLDGANVTDPAGQWNMQSLMPYDTIEEIQVVKSAKPAEIPYQGGYFNTVTKSGGNELHGAIAGYFSNDVLQGTNSTEVQREAGVESTNEIKREYEFTASLGGRILRDKLWWYASTRRQNVRSTVFGFPAEVNNTVNSGSLKLTYQPNSRNRVTGLVTRFSQDVSHFLFGFSPSLALDANAAAVRPVDATTVSLNWSGVLAPTVLADVIVSVARHGFDQQMQPGADAPPIVDLVNFERSQNLGDGSRVQDDDNASIVGSLSWFVPQAAGRHNVKAGLEYVPTTTQILFDDFEDHRLHTRLGRPAVVRFLNTPTLAVWNNDTTSLYVQDDWSVTNRLTINAGLRYMRTTVGTPEERVGGGTFANTEIGDLYPLLQATTLPAMSLIKWNTIEPRLAASYLVDPSGRTVLRLGASRYYHDLPSYNLFVSNPAFPLNYLTLWFDRNNDRRFQVGEQGRLIASFGGQINSVADDVRRPYTNEFLVGLSHEFSGGLQASANVIYRRDMDVMATVDSTVPFDTYTPVDVVDPGRDGLVGTGDDGSLTVFARDPDTIGRSRTVLTNPDGNERTYKGLELTASKRFSNQWQGVASLVVSKMEVVQPTTANAIPNLFDNPNGLINAKGLDPLNQTVALKLQGTYVFSTGLSASGFYRYLSGFPYTRELNATGPQGDFRVFAEPRGSSRTDASNIFDFRVEQAVTMAGGGRLGIILDVFNAFNAATVVEYGRLTGDDTRGIDGDYGQPRSIRNPRTARLGLRFMW